jgi:hypothetical protein
MIFESTPPEYSSVNDHLVYVAYDAHAIDPVTYPNYKYVAEVWINGVKQFTARIFPQPDNGRGIFDFGSVVRSYINATFAPGAGIAAQELGVDTFNTAVVIKLREEYSGTVGAVVLTDSSRVYFNHYNGRYNDFTALSALTNKPLSNRGLVLEVSITSNYLFLPYFSTSPSAFNVVITGGTATRTKTITPTAANTLQVLNISPGTINGEYSGNFTSATESYTVAVGGVTYTVKIVCPGKCTNYMLHFLNKWGGFESMLFNKARRFTMEIERKQFRQLPFRVSSSGVASVKSGIVMHQQPTVYASKWKEKLKVSTDYLFDVDYQWLAQLVASPLVYLEDGGTMYPVVITDTNYEPKEYVIDRMTNLALTLDFGTTNKTQYQ